MTSSSISEDEKLVEIANELCREQAAELVGREALEWLKGGCLVPEDGPDLVFRRESRIFSPLRKLLEQVSVHTAVIDRMFGTKVPCSMNEWFPSAHFLVLGWLSTTVK